ncbi:efflux RND transporter periplasmic adaptor subunit [Pseudodonghicola flavimaris]|uniref:Efflux RND transporter periplasmic adaptor subunit n=1 Tax=Pseudodonghicola flavimaris TaxID=3050036 RepID=A0ABT7F7Z6_9RHOB|nr:efflux RND transporter periplasmic adaptor subunit [Pseudodonghicola flavimaris]MDK3020738.1 efflux RND transporter periplasmic adaptor subunit [Pseudodonghicola flavimaris]
MTLIPRFLAALALAAGLATAAAAQPAMPPTAVSVLTLKGEPLPIVNELPGRVSATRISEVRPRVSGILIERVFEQGSLVQKGDVLYRIDPAPFQVQVKAAEASLARAQATLANAEVELERQRQLKARNVSSGVELESAQTTVLQAKADVALAEASLDEARLNLDYTEVRAPITGTIGRALVTEGALVSATGTQYLALIQQLDPVYADFTQSASQLFALRRALAAGDLVATAPGQASVMLYFDDGTAYAHKGQLLFSEAAVDETTGQITLRAEFPNPEGDLLPGLYVRVRIEQAVREKAIAIPQKAVLRDGRGNAQVYVLKEGNTVDLRLVQLGVTLGDRWMVDSGLEDGETIVVEGAQKLYPGATVQPEPVAAGN